MENQHQDQQKEAEMIFQMNQMNIDMSHKKNNFNRTPEPFNMSGMTQDLAGIQSQVTRDQMMVAQMQGMSVGQPHCEQQHCQLIFLQQHLALISASNTIPGNTTQYEQGLVFLPPSDIGRVRQPLNFSGSQPPGLLTSL